MLLVEDNVVNLKLLNTFVSKKGYMDVETAADGLQAVQAVERRAEGFDIIITGEKACQLIAGNPQRAELDASC